MKTFVCFQQSFSRHGIARASAALLIWLNENVHFHAPFLASAIRVNSIALGLTKWFLIFLQSLAQVLHRPRVMHLDGVDRDVAESVQAMIFLENKSITLVR